MPERDDSDYLMDLINRGEPIPAGEYVVHRVLDIGTNLVTGRDRP